MKFHKVKLVVLTLLLPMMLFGCEHVHDNDIATWKIVETNGPTMRAEYAMAYDKSQMKIIAFGGRTGFPDFNNVNETWSFDYNASTWSNLHPELQPPWRSSHTMVFDSRRNNILLFGGSDFSQAFNDLWTYDHALNTWVEIQTKNTPQARQMHGLVYVSKQDVLLLFGGRRVGGGASFNDTWLYHFDTNQWELLTTAHHPPVTDHVNLAYSSTDDMVLLFTEPDARGASPDSGRQQSTWVYDFTTNDWRSLLPVDFPLTNHSNLEYDTHHNQFVLFGNLQNGRSMVTWRFNTTENNWMNITPYVFPKIPFTHFPVIEHDDMVYIDDQNVFIQYGGCCSDTTLELSLSK